MEVMVVCLLIGLISGALLMSQIGGSSSIAVNAEKLALQAKVRMISDWISRDLRGAISWELNANTPSSSYVKFNLWEWDTAANTWKMGQDYVEYSYDGAAGTLARRKIDSAGSVLAETVFTGITEAPFYTSYTDPAVNQFDSNALLAKRMLIAVVTASHDVRGRHLSTTLITEVKIRNG